MTVHVCIYNPCSSIRMYPPICRICVMSVCPYIFLSACPHEQVQVKCISEHLCGERTVLLKQMRDACNKNLLRFNPDVGVLDSVLSAIKKSCRGGGGGHGLSMEGLKNIAESAAASYRAVHNADELPKGHVSRLIANGNAMDVCRNVVLSVSKPSIANPLPACMDPRRKLYHDWHWPLLLMR